MLWNSAWWWKWNVININPNKSLKQRAWKRFSQHPRIQTCLEESTTSSYWMFGYPVGTGMKICRTLCEAACTSKEIWDEFQETCKERDRAWRWSSVLLFVLFLRILFGNLAVETLGSPGTANYDTWWRHQLRMWEATVLPGCLFNRTQRIKIAPVSYEEFSGKTENDVIEEICFLGSVGLTTQAHLHIQFWLANSRKHALSFWKHAENGWRTDFCALDFLGSLLKGNEIGSFSNEEEFEVSSVPFAFSNRCPLLGAWSTTVVSVCTWLADCSVLGAWSTTVVFVD